MAAVRMHSPPARTVKRPNQRWDRQRPITRGGATDHAPPPVPTIGIISPNTGPAAGATTVTINGTNFTGATGATFGGVAGTGFSVATPTAIAVNTPAHAAGAVDVVVLHPNGNATKVGGFTYT